ncbi:MAG: SDR family oxidoreductase [Pseudomonadales bacterium]|nr:SDR family oxidoreductase [Pseudomonadales bacterium]
MTKRIVLTGGATGIGAASAQKLLAKNVDITILDLVEPKSSSARFVYCDMSNPASINEAVNKLPKEIDALVNVAGVSNTAPGEIIMGVNFLGLRHLSESLLPRIIAGGTIVNIASTAAFDWKNRRSIIDDVLHTTSFETGINWLREHESEWTDNPYKFSKQCTAAYTYRAVGKAIKNKVRINCIHPGSTGTQLTADFKKLVGKELYDWGVEQVGRQGTPEDIAEVIEFLTLGPCQWLNGVEIVVDGGFISGIVGGWIDPKSFPKAQAE